MSAWTTRTVALRFSLSDLTLGAWHIPMQTREVGLIEGMQPVDRLQPPTDVLDDAASGFLLRGVPVAGQQATLCATETYLCYVQRQYRHFYVDMRQTFDEYKQKFSPKTRSTINRKIRKYTDHCGGSLQWRTYRQADEMAEFHRLARAISVLTYQEKLLDAGLPESAAFLDEMRLLAAEDRVRAYVLFDGTRPVSYLYCPVRESVLIYAYLGYDPAYLKLSVGTVLQWLAFEQMFNEQRFRYFDFTEGESEHKRLFATDAIDKVNVMFLRRSLKHWLIINVHYGFIRGVESFGAWLESRNLKNRIRRRIRFGAKPAA